MAWYVVNVGRVPGIYRTWQECHAQVNGHPGNLYKKYNTEAEALAAYYGPNISNNDVQVEEMPAPQIEEMPAVGVSFFGALLVSLRKMLCCDI